MNRLVKSGPKSGSVTVPASKSQAHRMIICAALAGNECTLKCDGISKDIAATVKCLNALGAQITERDGGELFVSPIKRSDSKIKNLYCGESGSTLRFLIPVVGALGASAIFHMEGKLPYRPVDDLLNEVTSHGMTVARHENLLVCAGQLKPGSFSIPGTISSQYISGLLFALPLLDGDSTLTIEGKVESEDYVLMTENALVSFGARFEKKNNTYQIQGKQTYIPPKTVEVERDWSNAAFFLSMGAASSGGITVKDMPMSTSQGDMRIVEILSSFGAEISVNGNDITVRKKNLTGQTVDASQIPDLVPTICALAAGAEGTSRIINAERLKLKESDRLQTTADMLSSLGADIRVTDDGLVVKGKPSMRGGEVDSSNDHRIAMAAAVASVFCDGDVLVKGSECVEKSYPLFWNDLEALEVNK